MRVFRPSRTRASHFHRHWIGYFYRRGRALRAHCRVGDFGGTHRSRTHLLAVRAAVSGARILVSLRFFASRWPRPSEPRQRPDFFGGGLVFCGFDLFAQALFQRGSSLSGTFARRRIQFARIVVVCVSFGRLSGWRRGYFEQILGRAKFGGRVFAGIKSGGAKPALTHFARRTVVNSQPMFRLHLNCIFCLLFSFLKVFYGTGFRRTLSFCRR